MRLLHLRVWLRILLLTLGASCSCAVPAAEPVTPKKAAKAVRYADSLIASIKPTRLVTYKRVGDRELKLHLFLPAGWQASDRRPAFVSIHGGGWTGGDATRMYPFTAYFAARGMVAMSVEYRLLKPGTGVTVFDCVEDGRSALRYVRARAAELGIDPAKIVANGASAGGHVAVGAALFNQVNAVGDEARVSAEPNALILFYPVIDTSSEGYGNAKIGERWRELSPAHNVRAGLPPTLVFHGTGDQTTPFQGAARFLAEMKNAGNRCELDVNEGGIHGYLLTERPVFDDTLAKCDRFLASLGMLSK